MKIMNTPPNLSLLGALAVWLNAFLITLSALAQNVATDFKPTGVSGGGHLLTIAINPANTSQLLTSCDMSGVYRTSNQGANWTQVPSASLASMNYAARFQFVGSRIYGTQRAAWGSDVSGPAMSTDGGATWSPVGLPTSGQITDPGCYRVFADPASTSQGTQRLVLENYQKIFFSASGGAPNSWNVVASTTLGEGIRLAGVFWNGNSIYVGTAKGLYVSTNAGSTWALTTYSGLPAGAQIVDFCGARHPTTGPAMLFAICVNGSSIVGTGTDIVSLDGGYTYLGLYTATLTGTPTWTNRPGPVGQPFARVDVASGNSLKPWAVTAVSNDSNRGVFASTNGGATWTSKIDFTSNNGVTTGYQGLGGIVSWAWGLPTYGIDVSDSNPDMVAICGTHPYLTQNGGTSWQQIYVDTATQNSANAAIPHPKAYHHTGLGVTTGWWLTWLGYDRMLGCNTDVGLQLSADGGYSWTLDNQPVDGNGLVWSNWYGMAQQPGTNRLYAAVANINDLYEDADRRQDDSFREDYRKGNVLTSPDNGVTWTALGTGSNVTGGVSGRFPGPVFAVAVDPAQPSHIYACAAASHADYAGTGGIFRSTDTGTTWTRLTAPTRTEGRPYSINVLGTNQLVATYGPRQDASYQFTASSGVFYSSDGGSTWADRTATNMQYFTRDLAIANSSTWFAAVESINTGDHNTPIYDGRGGIYRTTDSGVTWIPLIPSIAKDTVQSVTYVPGSTPLLYVTTATDGLWVITDPLAGTPTSYIKVSAFPFARAKRAFADPYRKDGTIWVTTQGGGLWRGDPALSMVTGVVRNGANFDFRIDVMGTGGTAPTLTGTTTLAAGGPSTWSTLTGITPTTTSISGGTRYTWASVNLHSLYTGLAGGYARATRTRADGLPEVSEVGNWMTEAIAANTIETSGWPGMKTALYCGPASTSGSSSLVLATALPTSSFAAGMNYYVEMANGHRVEIDEASSISGAVSGSMSVLALDMASSLNTNGSTLPPLDNDIVRIREHWTLDEVADKTLFHGTNSSSTADTVYFWDNAANGYATYWFLTNGSTISWWTKAGVAPADYGKVVVEPGCGALMKVQATAMNGQLPTWGVVRDHLFRQPLPVGQSLISLGFPLTHSPTTAHLLVADGFTGTNSISTSDKCYVWQGDSISTQAWDTYWYLVNGTLKQWMKAGGGSTNFTTTPIFPRHRAFFAVGYSTAKPTRTVPCPWLP